LFGEARQELSIERLVSPYETPEKLRDVGGNSLFAGLSPDGRYVCTIALADRVYTITLISTSDQQAKITDTLTSKQLLVSKNLTWSDNGRYVSYMLSDNGQGSIGVIDTETGTAKRYSLPEWKRSDVIYSIKLSDDGQRVLIVKGGGSRLSFSVGAWSGSGFVSQYEHELGG
ncbi:hypothetical protein K0U00_47025, partial [Paenibacillus sepulcri]|nr:hypothetical protein [Paenibacillus sepulcri]